MQRDVKGSLLTGQSADWVYIRFFLALFFVCSCSHISFPLLLCNGLSFFPTISHLSDPTVGIVLSFYAPFFMFPLALSSPISALFFFAGILFIPFHFLLCNRGPPPTRPPDPLSHRRTTMLISSLHHGPPAIVSFA